MLVMGAGGSAIAMTWHVTDPERGADRPGRIVVTEVDAARLAHIRAIHDRLGRDVPVEYLQVDGARGNDAALAGLAPGSLVVNATGLGKDRPGSPVGEAARFPQGGVAWELNYRGDLVFLAQARAQAQARGLKVADGWTYFVHGWTQVIAEVFEVEIPTSGPGFDVIARLAAEATGRAA
jgi:shikimate 5-dehydrogenase